MAQPMYERIHPLQVVYTAEFTGGQRYTIRPRYSPDQDCIDYMVDVDHDGLNYPMLRQSRAETSFLFADGKDPRRETMQRLIRALNAYVAFPTRAHELGALRMISAEHNCTTIYLSAYGCSAGSVSAAMPTVWDLDRFDINLATLQPTA